MLSVCIQIPIVRDRLPEDHQRCEIVRAFLALCDSSTGHPNIQCSGLIMSQFKVEKGRISRHISNFLHPTSKLIAFARQERVLFWFQAMEKFLRLIVWLLYSTVTKVKGLTDLSDKAKIAEKGESLAKRKGNSATVTERLAASNGRQTSAKV